MDSRFPDRAAFRAALVAAARELDATVRDGPGEAFTVSGGTPACCNPNASPWKAIAVLSGDAWAVTSQLVALPWNRRRAAEIADHRTRQLEGLIRSPRKTEPHERSPFSAGPALADRAEAFTWIVAGGALAMAFALIATTLAGLPLIERELTQLSNRAEVITRIGGLPVPRASEIENLGWTGRLAAAFLLATPIAFFLGGMHAAVNAVGERFVSVARFAPWGLVFISASTLLALVTRAPVPLAILGAALTPAAAFLGTSLAWGRRRDVVVLTPGARRFRPALVVAIVLVLAVAVALVPTPTDNDNRIQETSRFRDRFLLGSSAGRALAHFYYAYTLYAAEPVRPAYSSNRDVRDRQVRTALLIGKFGVDVEALRAPPLNFTIERAKDPETAAPLIAKRQHDLYVVANTLSRPYETLEANGLLGRTIGQGGVPDKLPGDGKVRPVPSPVTQEDLEKALDDVFRLGGLDTMLLELTWLGWTSVFYAGPIFVLLLAAAPFAAALAWLARRVSPSGARRAVFGIFAGSVAALFLVLFLNRDSLTRVAALKRLPADDQKKIDVLAAGLRDPDPAVRYEAAFQAYMKLKVSSFPRGGLTPQLQAGTKDPSVRVRLWCAAALGLTRDASVRPDILAAMDDPEMLVRYRAAEGLENLDSKRLPAAAETVAKLKEMLRTRSWYEGMYALDALRKIEPAKY
ncbi:MAG TPA: HEAT repeat domain-containing protein [Planctomycetota bacterium]|nr:HEAT repeat domain-containing protein [Planctomycetota bacterium]